MGSGSPEIIYEVDEQGNFIGVGLRDELHKKTTSRRHAAVIALVLDDRNRLLVQWRGRSKLGGDRLDVSATTHVRKGEDYIAALKRCLKNELEISGITEITPLLDFKYEEELGENMENEYCRVYKVRFDGKTRVNRNEADYIEYLGLDVLKTRAAREPSTITKWLRETLDRVDSLR